MKFIQRSMMFPESLRVVEFLMMLEPEGVIKEKVTLMVNERYEEIKLEVVIHTYTSYARDLELSKQTESELSGKKPRASKLKVRNEEFEKCKTEDKCYKCFKDGKNVNYKDHNS